MNRAGFVTGVLAGSALLALLSACSGGTPTSPTAAPPAPAAAAPTTAAASPTTAAAASPVAPTAPPPTVQPTPAPTRAASPSPSPSPVRAASPVASPASAASPAASDPASGYARFDGSAAGFTIDYPRDWTVDSSKDNVVAFTSPDSEANFSVAYLNLGGTMGLDQLASDFLKSTPFSLTEAGILPTTLAGEQARMAPWTATSASGEPTEGAVFVLNRGPWSYALTGTATKRSGKTHDNSLTGLLDSFRLVSPGQAAGSAAPPAPAAPPAAAPAASPAAPAPSFTVYDGSAAGYLIAYPLDWTVDTSRENVVAFSAPDGLANFSVTSLNVGSLGLDEGMTSFLQGLPGTVTAAQPARVADVDARVAGFTATNNAGEPIAGGTYFLIKGQRAFALTGTSAVSAGKKYDAAFDGMVASFTTVP